MDSWDSWVVITADIVHSSRVARLRELRDQAIADLSERHLGNGLVLGRYTITAWDEFQNVLSSLAALPDVLWDLHLASRPELELRFGIGIGHVEDLPDRETPINKVCSGDAFVRSRAAIKSAAKRTRGGKYDQRTVVCSGDKDLDARLNLIYMLTDSLISNLSTRQWQAIIAYEELGSQEKAARRLRVKTASVISRTLQRGFYWQLKDAREGVRQALERYVQEREGGGG